MGKVTSTRYDVVVVGGGPAGINACLRLVDGPNLKILLLENEKELGGIPRSAHVFFGMRDRKRLYSGPTYARKLRDLVRKTNVDIRTEATVLRIIPGDARRRHQLHVASPQGMSVYEARFVILAMGCFEGSRESRLIPGGRPAGVFTTGILQKMVNLQHLRPGRRAVIVGSEHVAFSVALTLKHSGTEIVAMVEPETTVQTYPSVAGLMRRWAGFPIITGAKVKSIVGGQRVEGVELEREGGDKTELLDCDMVVVTGDFRPESALLLDGGVALDPKTNGPVVDYQLETSVPNIFAAGNILHGANMHDFCAIEGRHAAQSILDRLSNAQRPAGESVYMTVEAPIRFVVPQKIQPGQAKTHHASWFSPGVSLQVERSLRNVSLGAYCCGKKIWEKKYAKIIANTAIPLPVENFDWRSVKAGQGIELRCTC